MNHYSENTNFTQTKLEKHEWEYIEVPVSESEKIILNNITQGFENPSLSVSAMQSLLSFLKIENNDNQYEIHSFIAHHYFNEILSQIATLYRLLTTYVFTAGQFTYEDPYDDFISFIKTKGFDVDESDYTCILSLSKTIKRRELKRKDKMRIENTMLLIKNSEQNTSTIYEYVITQHVLTLLCFIFTKDVINPKHEFDGCACDAATFSKIMRKFIKKKKKNEERELFVTRELFIENAIDRIYALNVFLKDTTMVNHNPILVSFLGHIVDLCILFISKKQALSVSHLWVENNTLLNKYRPFTLYQHQRDIISVFKEGGNHFVYYCAPTGTGKTLTPLALAKKYKIIFVCAARHVGLSFAKNAVSCGYKIALAFNCGDSEDIRLHYSAAKVFKKNYKTGGIFRVDNTMGHNVEIIISDVKSYKYASYYMSAFNDVNTIITFWDEPTISLDYEEHELHSYIRDNWENNIIPNMVLSSATLPKEGDIQDVANGFCNKFKSTTHYIKTHDFRKSICIYDEESHIFSPHLFFIKHALSYSDATAIINTFLNDKTLFRYLHISSCIEFLIWYDNTDTCLFMSNSEPIFKWEKLTQEVIKEAYITLMKNAMTAQFYERLLACGAFKAHSYYKSTSNFLGEDAYTLTNGATIYLTNTIDKTRAFFINQIKIPKKCIHYLREVHVFNEAIHTQIVEVKKNAMDKQPKTRDKTDDSSESFILSKESTTLRTLESQFKKMQLPHGLIPNSYEHLHNFHGESLQNLYLSQYKELFKPFSSTLSERDIEKVISLQDIDSDTLFLLLCGIGIVCGTMTREYNALISEFATRQKLFIVIASSDYIYGTNYLFHHAYIDTSIKDNTRQKIIQAMGRVGRGQYNQHYSVRIKNKDILTMLFNEEYDSYIETRTMNKLLVFPPEELVVDADVLERTNVKDECLITEEWVIEAKRIEFNTQDLQDVPEVQDVESWEDLI